MCVFVSTLGHPPGRAVSRTVSGCVGGLGCRSCSLEAGLHTRLIGGAPGCWCCAHPCVCRRSSASSHTTRSVAMAARGGESGAVRATHRWISGLSRAALLLLPVVRPSPTEPTRVLSMNLTPGGRTRHTHCDGVVSRGHPTRPRLRRLTCSTCARLVCAAPPPGSDRVRVEPGGLKREVETPAFNPPLQPTPRGLERLGWPRSVAACSRWNTKP